MRFLIRGADRQTGRDIEISIDAASVDEAETRATDAGVLVATVHLVDRADPPNREPPSGTITDTPRVPRARPVVIEQTSKSVKRWILIGGLVFAGGWITLPIAALARSGSITGAIIVLIGVGMILGGAGVYFVAKFNAWWRHG